MRRLFIVRPEPGASKSVDRATAMGLDAVAMPLFVIEPLAWEVPDPRAFDALLLTSANAIRNGGAGLEAVRGLPAYAVGEATAAAAREAGLEIAASGDAGVERLLGSIEPDMRLLHLCGEHRIVPDAKQSLTAIVIYRSAELPPPAEIGEIEGQTVAIHSPRAGQRLSVLADQATIDRGTVRIAAISPAASSAAGAGWERCESAASPDEAALLALAARLCDNRPSP